VCVCDSSVLMVL